MFQSSVNQRVEAFIENIEGIPRIAVSVYSSFPSWQRLAIMNTSRILIKLLVTRL
jgi:hypothetical protein